VNEWNKLRGSITEEEVSRAKAQMRSGFIMGQESTSSRAEYLAKNILTFGKLISNDAVLKEIESITINSIEEVLTKIFTSAEPVLSIIGPDASFYKKINLNTLLN
jgi:predicted Zn-dependent peptidase